ncbi:Uncharacterised protein [Slackia heliotrinireducens]|uniref:DUF4190 domain-containing protein n=1 Tax=Slackia heliotrinireducens (strain ATCC 29202 / DSM 20476 / NCTC 11029 / RHS 1) TaxID=471855 RepID=C7N5Z9_SLAHD|nr:DUF4190 domain-containing protein [Slackia heliotrinireducens]ACV22334.1 hypothetical protein Shel_13070 [Slackia heliotrinireducens DSM 20476]VEH00570.1 Uncharacterised protein [Slackia heliotrinireducens]
MSNEEYDSRNFSSAEDGRKKHTVFTDADQTPIAATEPVRPPEPAPPAPASPYETYKPAKAQEPYSSQVYYQPTEDFDQHDGGALLNADDFVAPSASAALVCGVLALVTSSTVIPSVMLGIAAIALARRHVNNYGRDGKATAGKVCGIVSLIISALMLLGVTAAIIGSSLDDYSEVEEVAWSDSVDFSDDAADEAFAAMYDPTCEYFTHPDEDFEAHFKEALNSRYQDQHGYTLTEMGVDVDEVYEFLISGTTVELDSSCFYGYTDGTATAYPRIHCYNLYLLDTFTSAFMNEVGYDASAQTYGEAFTKGFEEFKKVDKTVTTDGYTAYVSYQKNGDTWEFADPDALKDEASMAYDIYY